MEVVEKPYEGTSAALFLGVQGTTNKDGCNGRAAPGHVGSV